MPDPVITNLNLGSIVWESGEFRDELLTFAGAATVLAGTILARDSGTLKLVPFVKGGVTAENGIPKAILTYDVTAAGAGDEAIRDMVSGTVRGNLMIINADGDNSNVDAAVLDQLRDYSLVTIDVSELNILDNS